MSIVDAPAPRFRAVESASTPSARLLDALHLQITVIGALMLRELHTRYGRENLGFLWLMAEPLVLCLGVIGIWTLLHGRYQHGLPILAFVITGYIPLTLWRHITARAVHCFRANSSLLYHRQVRMMDLMVARIVLEILGTSLAYLVAAFIFWSVELYELPLDWGLFLLGWFYMASFSAGFGLVIGSLSEFYEWMEKLISPLMYLLLPFCGMFFMTDWLSDRVRRLALYVPTVNAFELIRAGQFGPGARAHYDLPYETLVCTALLLLGILLCRNVHRHLVIE